MTRSRWWDLIVGAACALGVMVAWFAQPSVPRAIAGMAGLVLIATAWFTLGRRAQLAADRGAALALQTAVVIGSGLAVTALPLLATVQAIGYPIIWTTSRNRREAVGASTALAASVAAGFLVARGVGVEGITSGAISAGLSLVFAIAMGLWVWAIHDESEARRALVAELTATRTALAAASREAGAAAERERWARDVHDTVAQDLTGLVMGLRRLRSGLPGKVAADTDADAEDAEDAGAESRELVTVLETLASDALAEARALVTASAPPPWAEESEGGGAPAAVRRVAERFAAESGVAVDVRIDGLPTLSRDREVVLLRVAQEALANVRKHARATAVTVQLTAAGDRAVLRVADDGVGFDPAAPSTGYGLPGMRERLIQAGGAWDVRSGADGTTITATVPVDVPLDESADESPDESPDAADAGAHTAEVTT